MGSDELQFWSNWMMTFVGGVIAGIVVLIGDSIRKQCPNILDCPLDYGLFLVFMIIGFFVFGFIIWYTAFRKHKKTEVRRPIPEKPTNTKPEFWRPMYITILYYALGVMIWGDLMLYIVQPDFRLPFDFATISLTLAGLMIVAGVWKQKEFLDAGKKYILGAILFVMYFTSLPFAIPRIGSLLAPEFSFYYAGTVLIGLIFLFSSIFAPFYFTRATQKMLESLPKEEKKKRKRKQK